MPEKTSTYEPMVLVDTADLPEDEWLEWRRRGIGGSDAAAILGVSPFATARDLYYLMILLTPFNVTPTAATKIYEHFGSRSVDILHKNPYELCQVSGFGFKRVDAIVRKGDLPLNSPMRIHGAVFAALDTGRSEKGHLFLDETTLAKTGVKLLNENSSPEQVHVTPEEVDAVIQDMIMKGEIVCSNGNIYQINSFVQEDETARKIAEMLSVPATPVDITAALGKIRRELGVAPSKKQTEAVYMAYRSLLSIITGGPGTGKTTVLRVIIETQKLLYPDSKILLAAPTGRASRRMAESTGMDGAKTLHSLLGLLGDSEPIRKDKQKEPLDADLIIVDESSMIDMWLARQFFQRVRPGTRVVLVGDVDQLQSVGAGDVFRELIDSGLIPVTVLDEIFRQKKGSLIAYNAKRINEANIDLQYGEDFQFVKCQTQEEAADLICRIFCEQVREHGIEKVQILSPFRSEGLASVEHLNTAIRELVNPIKDEIADLKVGSNYFRVGDKVMQTKNNDKASNGDIGYIRKMGRNEKNEMIVTIEFSGGRVAEYGMEEMSHIELAYATTVHKAMGSEFDIVIMPILRSQAAWESAVAMDDNQLLQASVKRLADDAERVTRRNMKQCVTEYIQTHCYEDMDFARQVMHPRKSMIRCFRYINRKAKGFVKQEMEDNDEKATDDGYGCDVPDDLCYQWAVEYFMDMEAPEDKTEDDKEFVPKPYTGKAAPKSKKKTEKKKPAPKKETPKPAEDMDNQMNIFDLGGAADEQACAS